MIVTQVSLFGLIMTLELELEIPTILTENCSFGSSSKSLIIGTLPQSLWPSAEGANVSSSVVL